MIKDATEDAESLDRTGSNIDHFLDGYRFLEKQTGGVFENRQRIQISAVIVFCLIAAGISGYVNERDYRKEWCERTEKMMKTETLAPAVRDEYNERCK